jgi:probable rRNA maturation factor
MNRRGISPLLFSYTRGALIVTEPPSRPGGQLSSLPKAALSRFLKRAQKAAGLEGEVTVLLADDARLKELNSSFRHKNKPTDVLSFPAFENEEGIAGDLAISLETAKRQADEHGHALEDEVRILMLHGVLHLAGYDHEVDNGEMRALEAELREELKLPVGLIERTLAAPKKKAAAKKSAVKKAPAKKAAAKKTAPRKKR